MSLVLKKLIHIVLFIKCVVVFDAFSVKENGAMDTHLMTLPVTCHFAKPLPHDHKT